MLTFCYHFRRVATRYDKTDPIVRSTAVSSRASSRRSSKAFDGVEVHEPPADRGREFRRTLSDYGPIVVEFAEFADDDPN